MKYYKESGPSVFRKERLFTNAETNKDQNPDYEQLFGVPGSTDITEESRDLAGQIPPQAEDI
jgi:hypothetical protein